MHPRQASLLHDTNEVVEKIAAKKPVALSTPVLWKYTDPDTNQEFFLTERKMTIKSPYSGKSFSAKPEKMTVPAVGKDLRQDAAPPAGPKLSTPRKR